MTTIRDTLLTTTSSYMPTCTSGSHSINSPKQNAAIILDYSYGKQGRTKREKIDTYVPKRFFALPEGGGRVRRPHPSPITPHNLLCKQPYSKCFIIKGQGGYIADTQPPGRAAAACVPATHSAEQRRKGERARESGHNEHGLHTEFA